MQDLLTFQYFFLIFMILGDYCDEVHLFPFRTEKLSSSAQMVLLLVGEYVVAIFNSPSSFELGLFFMLKILFFIACFFIGHGSFAQGEENSSEGDLTPIIFRSNNSDQVFLGLFDNYFGLTPMSSGLLDTGLLKTRISYEIGTNRFQQIDINHQQKFSERSRLFLDFARRTYDGTIDHSVFENSLFRAGYTWKVDTGFAVNAQFSHSSLNKELNWGMSSDTLIENPQLNRALVPVYSESAEFLSRVYHLQGDVMYGKGPLKLGFGLDIQRRDFLYSDDIGTNVALYDTIYFDSTLTQDLMKEGYEQGYAQLKTKGKVDIVFKTGLLRRYYENFGFNKRNMPFSSLELSKGDRVNFGFISVYGDGVFVNSYVNLNLDLTKGWKLNVDSKMTHGNNSEFYTRYSSNHFVWDKVNSQNTRFRVDAAVSDSLKRYGAKLQIKAENNAMIWSDSLKQFEALSALQSIMHSELWIKQKLGNKWDVSVTYGFNPGLSGTYFKYPLHTIKSSISKKGKLFKGKLKYQLALLPEYYSKFEQYEFNPVLFSVYPSNTSNEIPGYLYTNLKLTAWLGGVELFFKVWHINQGITPYNYFDNANYWGKDRFFSFGLKKVFTN